MRVLFVCSKNKWRSPTAEAIFAGEPGVDCLSAGLNHDSENPLTAELVEWAEIIFVMETSQKAKLQARHKDQISGARSICLGIPDKYPFMDPALIKLLKAKVPPYLRMTHHG